MPPTVPDVRRCSSETDVLILCGGLGTRLQAVVPGRPKALAPIQGRPFLDILVDALKAQGFRRFIFCVGHHKEQILERYGIGHDAEYLFSAEAVPLGTGGAVQNALPLARSSPVLVVNGDSLCRVDYEALYRFHFQKAADASFVLAKATDRNDAGMVRIDDARRVISFSEKTSRPDEPAYVNAGIYLLNTEALAIGDRRPPFSLERELFPALVNAASCFGFVVDAPLVDIGTPDRYRRANADGVESLILRP